MFTLIQSRLKTSTIGMLCLLASPFSHAQSTDLSTWTTQGGSSSWNVLISTDAVLQTINGDPTVMFDPATTSTQGTALSGKIRVTTSDDDDFIGFVLGYNSGEINSPTANFVLVDWKQGNQGNGKAGIAISHVTNAASWWPDFWDHAGGVQEIARGSNLGSTGWEDATEYTFNILFTATQITVDVNGVTELSITPADAGLSAFPDGSFGFYNMSQSHVLYSAIRQIDCSATPYAPECGTPKICDISIETSAEVIPGGGGSAPDCGGPGSPRPSSLTFQYTGAGCSASSNQQGNEDVCSGDVGSAGAVTVFGRTSNGHHHHSPYQGYNVDPSTPIAIGETFTLTRRSICEDDFASQTYIDIRDSNNSSLKETNRIHTSCKDSEPLSIGDVFGSLTLVAINGQTGTGSGNDVVNYTYTVTNRGDALQNLTVTDSSFGTIGQQATLAEGLTTPTTASFTYTTNVQETTFATVTADLNGIQDCSNNYAGLDSDFDGVPDSIDNCIYIPNADQTDINADGVGDACEPIIYDTDGDGVPDNLDNCIFKANPDQTDSDGNGIGDACSGSGAPPTGCNSSQGNIDLLIMLMLICAIYYAVYVNRSRELR